MSDRTAKFPIQAVLLDFGGVLYQTPRPRWLPFLLKVLRLSRRGNGQENGILLMMHASAVESQVVMDLMTGKVPEQKVWDDLEQSWGIPPAWFQRIRRGAFAQKRLNWDLLEYVTHLRSQQIKAALLTNAGTDFRPTFVKEYNLDAYFDRVIISAEEGVAKPDAGLFLKASDYLGMDPAQAVFFDDLPENVTGAREAGMQAFEYKNNEQVKNIIDQYLKG